LTAGLGLPMREELQDGEPDVFSNLTQQCRRDVTAGMKWNGSAASGGIAKLLVGSALPHFGKAQLSKDGDYLRRLEYWDISHGSSNGDVLYSDKFRFEDGVAILQQHRYHFAKIGIQLIERGALRMRSGESRYESHKETGVGVALNHRGKVSH